VITEHVMTVSTSAVIPDTGAVNVAVIVMDGGSDRSALSTAPIFTLPVVLTADVLAVS
jgi:hypothetical protein